MNAMVINTGSLTINSAVALTSSLTLDNTTSEINGNVTYYPESSQSLIYAFQYLSSRVEYISLNLTCFSIENSSITYFVNDSSLNFLALSASNSYLPTLIVNFTDLNFTQNFT